MIIWINGAFGSGKSTLAHELHALLRGPSFVFDPENTGNYLLFALPKTLQSGDYQNIPLWRSFNRDALLYISERCSGTIIVPMTLTSPEYYGEIISYLRVHGVDVRHCVLGADRTALAKRRRSRFDGSRSWAAKKADECIAAFENPIFENYIDASRMSVDDELRAVAALFSLPLRQDTRGKAKKLLDRKLISLRMMALLR